MKVYRSRHSNYKARAFPEELTFAFSSVALVFLVSRLDQMEKKKIQLSANAKQGKKIT